MITRAEFHMERVKGRLLIPRQIFVAGELLYVRNSVYSGAQSLHHER
jgi:hypothetical protein